MVGCAKEISVYSPSGFGFKEVKTVCGSTSPEGYPQFCDVCSRDPDNDRDWRREAIQAGEQWDDDY